MAGQSRWPFTQGTGRGRYYCTDRLVKFLHKTTESPHKLQFACFGNLHIHIFLSVSTADVEIICLCRNSASSRTWHATWRRRTDSRSVPAARARWWRHALRSVWSRRRSLASRDKCVRTFCRCTRRRGNPSSQSTSPSSSRNVSTRCSRRHTHSSTGPYVVY